MWFDGLSVVHGLRRAALGVFGASLLVLCLAGLFAASAWPRMHAGPGVMDGGRRLGGSPVAPLDGFAQPAAAYSFRKLRSAYTGPAIGIIRASDFAYLVVGYLGYIPGIGAPIDFAAAANHCASTTCWVEWFYDQSGNERHIQRSGLAPDLIFNCVNGLPCARSTSNGQYMVVSGVPMVAKTAISTVSGRLSGATSCQFVGKGLNNFSARDGLADTWFMTDYTSAAKDFTAANGVMHAVLGNIDGINSLVRADGVETAPEFMIGDPTTPNNLMIAGGLAGSVCQGTEWIMWDNYTLTPAERAALQSSQKNFWGTP